MLKKIILTLLIIPCFSNACVVEDDGTFDCYGSEYIKNINVISKVESTKLGYIKEKYNQIINNEPIDISTLKRLYFESTAINSDWIGAVVYFKDKDTELSIDFKGMKELIERK